MINFGGYYYVQETDIVAIERKRSSNEEYPFEAVVRTRNGLAYSVGYKTETARAKAAADMARKVEYVTRDKDMEQIFSKLWLMQSDLARVDKRQLKIWRQLKELLGLKGEEDVKP